MVLYIFHVNTGMMLTFDMEMALQTVQNLKDTIERLHGIPAANQVLLISGGEVLHLTSRVCSFPSGTDENPIYMFSTMFDSPKQLPPWPSENHIHYEDEVNRCLVMPPEYNTVVIRAKLAHKMYESATKEIKICERLVYEQHLQQQGWAAVMANLEDLNSLFKQRSADFLNTINDYLERRPHYLEYLKAFPDDLLQLSTVPILAELMPSAEHDFHGFDKFFHGNVSLTGSTSADSGTSVGGSSSNSRNRESLTHTGDSGGINDSSSQTQGQLNTIIPIAGKIQDIEPNEPQQIRSLTLLQWISSKENHRSLRDMAEDCSRVLNNFDANAIEKIKISIKRTLEIAEQENVREVRGLTQRLEQLDELMCDAKKMVQEQKELSTAFQQNQSRASNLGDTSILPDLCMSHSNHLTVMLQNHNKLLDIEKRIMKAKEELGENLNKRLRYVVHIQNSISDLDSKLLFHHRCFQRLKHHLVIIEQIHEAPTIYVTAVTEVVRRRIFSDAMLKWGSELASHMLTIYREEETRRQDFGNVFDRHFLNALFDGLNDKPPAFATEAPTIFDTRLPSLTKSDLQALSEAIPDITSKIEMPDLKYVLEFFSTSSGSSESSSDQKHSEGMKSLTNKLLDIRAFKDGCESETDTEEFEKVDQSPNDRAKDGKIESNSMGKAESNEIATSTCRIETTNIETLTEDNAGTAQTEVERLKSLIVSMSQLSRNSISLLREQLRTINDGANCDKDYFAAEFKRIANIWNDLKVQHETNERELINRLTVDHELELTDVRKLLSMKSDEVAELRAENSKLLEKLANSELSAEKSKNRSSDEIDSLRSRIAELEQLVNNNEIEKTKAVNETKDRLIREHKTEIESLRCRYKLMKNVDRTPSDTSLEKIERTDLTAMQVSSPASSQSLYRRILDEKERQIDTANQQLEILNKENAKFKQTIQSLTDDEHHDSLVQLKDQVETLRKEKQNLRQKLNMERSRKMECSNDKGLSGEATSSSVTKSTNRLRQCSKKCIRVDSCENGDTVLVVWNDALHRYIVAQDSVYLHFLAEDSHPLFHLPVPNTKDVTFDNISKPAYFLASVTDKQYCMVRKEGTRYRVPIGTKFFRIKVKPLVTNSRSLTDTDKNSKKDAQKSPLTVTRSLSIQLIDSFAQTELAECVIPEESVDFIDGNAKEMIDSGVDQVQRSDRSSVIDDVASCFNERLRLVSIGDEDAALIVNNLPLSQEETNIIIDIVGDNNDADQDDSDEYRSLEAKSDDAEPIKLGHHWDDRQKYWVFHID